MPEQGEPIVPSSVPSLSSDQKDEVYRNSVGVNAPVTAGDFAMTALNSVVFPHVSNHIARGFGKAWAQNDHVRAAETISKTGLRPQALRNLHRQWEAQGLSTADRLKDLREKVRPGTINSYKARRIVDYEWRKANPAPRLMDSVKGVFTPSLPGVAVQSLFSMANPFGDPKYKSGERGYLKSWWEGQKHQADHLGDRGREARERYGIAGIPIQMFHGLTNPVSSLLYGGRAVKDYFSGKEAALRIDRAESAVHLALAQLTN